MCPPAPTSKERAMRVTRAGWALLALGTTGALLVAGAGTPSAAPTTTLISKNAAGQAGTGGGGLQVFLRDRVARTTRIASVTNAGRPGNSVSFFPAVNDPGGVVFQSLAFNLLPPGTPSGGYQIYYHSL